MGTEARPPSSHTHSLSAVPVAPVAAAAAPSLVPIESSVGNPEFVPPERVCHRMYPPPEDLPAPSFYQAWVHAGWAHKRAGIYSALVRTGQTHARCWAFAGCCGVAHLEEKDYGNGIRRDYRIRASRCHDRFCTHCANIRAWDIQRALHARTAKIQKPMLITLTLVSKPKETLRQKIDEMKKGFRALRSHPLWGEAVSGGACFLEVTRGKCGDRWHVHYHIVADAKYMDQRRLSDAWRSITKDSFVVWIERPASGDGVGYSAKYAAKGLDLSICVTPDLVDEVVLAFKGERTAFCFGDWYGTSFAADIEEDRLDEEETASAPWRTICTLQCATAAALEGDPYFAAAVRATKLRDWFNASPNAPPL